MDDDCLFWALTYIMRMLSIDCDVSSTDLENESHH